MNSSANQFENHSGSEVASTPSVSKKGSTWRWLLIGLLTCCALGSVATLAFLWLTSLPPRTNCGEISPLSPDIDRLSCAQEAARSGELADLMTGLKLVESWAPEHPLHNEAQRWMEEWSKSVLIIARQKMADSDLQGAIELASRIPKSSPSYADAQAAIANWKDNWQVDQAIYARAQEALKQQDWAGVSQRILELSESPYRYWNSEKVNELSQRVLTEKKARQTLAEAKRLAQFSTPQDIKAAIDLSRKMDAQSYTWAEAQPMLQEWGNTLLTIGVQRWQERRLDEAISFAQTTAAIPALKTEAQNLLKLSQARQLAIASDTRWKATPKHIWNLMEATAATRQIPADSRFYAQAQESLKSWEAQLKDTTQLQYAQVMADLGQRDLVQTAIAQAETIGTDRPRRLQAQTLIAHWQNEVERIEDRPHLLLAQQMAEPGTLPALKAAIAEAGKVQMGRVLRGEAQGLIYEWNWQIQAIEDRPFLTMARLQADQGNLSAAIRAAATVQPGRSLYYEAQAAIADWQAELNRAALARTRRETQRDQPRLDVEETELRSADDRQENQILPSVEAPAATLKTPGSEAVTPVEPLPAPPVQSSRPSRPAVETEAPSPFVLQENTPLFEDPEPATDRYRDLDDVPRLINRRSERREPAPAASPAEIFPTPPDAQLFEEPEQPSTVETPIEEAVPPVTDSVPADEEVPLVEELVPSVTESSSLSQPTAQESAAEQSALPASEDSLSLGFPQAQDVPVSMSLPKSDISPDQ